MKKKLFRSIIIVMIMTLLIPIHASATQQEGNSLSTVGFQDVMAKVAANTIIIDSYAKTIRDLQATDLTNISSINKDLRANMQKNQKNAQTNAVYWLNNVKPHMLKTNQHIVDYNDTFQAHYSTLLTAIEQQDVQKIEGELKQLYESVLRNKGEVDGALEKLTTFRNKMVEDTKNFKDDANHLTSILASTNAGIPALQSEINRHNSLIKTGNILIGTGSAMCVLIIGCIAGGPMIADGVNKKKEANREIERITAQISGIEKEVVILTDIQNKITNMTETMDPAITSLQNIANNWHTVASKYSALLKNINVISPEEFAFIKEDLHTARDSWNELKEYAQRMNEGMKQIQ
jgi:non-hemolytic enterotoxin B/C